MSATVRLVFTILFVVSVLIVVAGRAVAVDTAKAREEHADMREARGRGPGALSRWRDASPEERRAMRQVARRKWERASPHERRIFRRAMYGLSRALPEFSEIERLVLVRKLFAMSKDERRVMRERLREIDDLSVAERVRLVEELREMAHDADRESAMIESNVDRWRGMSESERDRYRAQMRRFRELSAEERGKLLDEWEAPERAREDLRETEEESP